MKTVRLWHILPALSLALVLVFSMGGSASAIDATIDLSQGEQDFVVMGAKANAYTGEVTSSADFNGDGVDDLLIGAGGYDHDGKTFVGAAYVIFGSPSLAGEVDLGGGDQANLTVYGPTAYSALGHAVAAGDINGDRYEDLIIAADAYNNSTGRVYVILGGKDRFSTPTTIDLTSASPTERPALTIDGGAAGDRFGRSVSSGDINKDGYDDIVVGAYNASPSNRTQAGAVYVFYGNPGLSTSNPATITAGNANVTILGAGGATAALTVLRQAEAETNLLFADEVNAATAGIGDRLGRSTAAADVNADGFADLILGAYGADVGAATDAGKTYVIYGGQLNGVIDLASAPVALTLNGIDANDQSGFYVTSGMVNNDGFADIVIGAYLAQGFNNSGAETGEVYVVYGGAFANQSISLSGANVTIFGAAGGDRLGRSLATGDINGFGFDDLILGASRADPDGRTDAGITYLVQSGNLPAQIQLSQPGTANVQILGAATSGETCTDDEAGNTGSDCSDEVGRASAAGDVNGDGTDDIVVGALFVNNGSTQDAGATYVIFADPLQQLYLPFIFRP